LHHLLDPTNLRVDRRDEVQNKRKLFGLQAAILSNRENLPRLAHACENFDSPSKSISSAFNVGMFALRAPRSAF
jgi:hypothetical protein